MTKESVKQTTSDEGRKTPAKYQHHEYALDVRSLTRGQLLESYTELKAELDAERERSRTLLEDIKPLVAFVQRMLDEGAFDALEDYYDVREAEKPLKQAQAAIAAVEGSVQQ